MKRKFSLVMSAAMILSIIAPMTNALAEDIQTPETASTETIVAADTACGGTTYYVDSTIGDDSNSGTSPETPWKTLDKVTASLTFSLSRAIADFMAASMSSSKPALSRQAL